MTIHLKQKKYGGAAPAARPAAAIVFLFSLLFSLCLDSFVVSKSRRPVQCADSHIDVVVPADVLINSRETIVTKYISLNIRKTWNTIVVVLLLL